MAGVTLKHNLIVAEVIYLLMDKLRRGPCRVLPSDMRVQVGESYVYSDVAGLIYLSTIDFMLNLGMFMDRLILVNQELWSGVPSYQSTAD